MLWNSTCPPDTPNEIVYSDPRWREGFAASAGCALFATAFSVNLMYTHWKNYNYVRFQRPITRILFMVPVYAICAALSYFSIKSFVYLAVISSCYEAFIVWNFFSLILEYAAENEDELKRKLMLSDDKRLPFPLLCFTYNPGDRRFIGYCRAGVVQYIVVRITFTFISLIAEWMGKFCVDSNSYRYAHFYYEVFNATSVTIAMYALITFYVTVHHEIQREGTLFQFLSVKAVIFVQFWLVLVIKGFVYFGYIQGNNVVNVNEYSMYLTSLIICIEMALATIVHYWAFKVTPFVVEGKQTNPVRGFLDAFNFSDIAADAKNGYFFLRDRSKTIARPKKDKDETIIDLQPTNLEFRPPTTENDAIITVEK
ncbi:hypothetical protein HK103_003249 [Boothiomyces macroporosus]|uniref:Organic solute transporter Ostalpha-domain-containing protein n=1 Tax=Boothiomyces macroporosus TaxID=261099 RepID=A0AAD5Y956_9FUNG|nr:hypothetical protein HK103_003249 [Boothiomyces macroporosus]